MKILETSRLLLREFTLQDADALALALSDRKPCVITPHRMIALVSSNG